MHSQPPTDWINATLFDQLAELMEDGFAALVTHYLESARGYVAAIDHALESHQARAMVDAAHPLKSSSQQLGAQPLAAIAKEIEIIGKSATPEWATLTALVSQLHTAHAATQAAITARMQG